MILRILAPVAALSLFAMPAIAATKAPAKATTHAVHKAKVHKTKVHKAKAHKAKVAKTTKTTKAAPAKTAS